jgi:hypothetical protein
MCRAQPLTRQTTIATLLEAGNSHRQIERVTGIDRKTIRAYHQRIEQQKSNSPGVATGCTDQIPPPRPPDGSKSMASICEPHRTFIEAQLRLKRNYMSSPSLKLFAYCCKTKSMGVVRD